MKEAQRAGFSGTPSFMLAVTGPKDPKKVKGLVPLVGAQPYEKFKTEIEKALVGNQESPDRPRQQYPERREETPHARRGARQHHRSARRSPNRRRTSRR